MGDCYGAPTCRDKERRVSHPRFPKRRETRGHQINRCQDIRTLCLHRANLGFALDMLDLLSKQDGECTRIQQGLWRSAIIHYAKCFGKSNARNRLEAETIFKSCPPEAMVCHKYFKHLRNKNVAHDENAYSQALAAAIINKATEPYKIAKIISAGFYAESLNTNDYQNLLNLVRKAIEYVEKEIDLVCKRITAELEKLPYDNLLKMDSVKYTPPTPNDVSKPRVTYY
jgi:hypothetical protein